MPLKAVEGRRPAGLRYFAMRGRISRRFYKPRSILMTAYLVESHYFRHFLLLIILYTPVSNEAVRRRFQKMYEISEAVDHHSPLLTLLLIRRARR